VAVLAAAGLMVASATGGALLALAIDEDEGGSGAPAATSLDAEPTTAGGGDAAADEPLSQAAAEVLPSVVMIGIDAGPASGSGSGIVISEDGQILTNNHVVAAADDGGELTVTFSDGSTAEAELVGRDPASDLAVIQARDVSGLTPAELGSSADLNVGDTVLAIGSPLGLDGSVSSGIVSALGRAIRLQGEQQPEPPFGGRGDRPTTNAVIDAIQTDAAINPGNSGGALVNTDGQVVGINTAIASLAQGPTGQGGNIVEDGSVSHAYLGVQIVDAGTDGDGALVGAVESGQPADDAGLTRGDVIVELDGDEISDATDLTAAIRSHEPGDSVPLTYERDGDENTVEVTLGELPS
jgi:putative serine protease PepD